VTVETEEVHSPEEVHVTEGQCRERLRHWLREYASNVGHEATCASVFHAGEDTPDALCDLGCLDRRSFGVPFL
jgi:hypothetical protein